MKAIIQLRAAARALSITTNHLFLIFFLCLALPALASAQDPLAPCNLPAIDTNPAHYPSNIWITDTMTKVRQDAGSPGAQHWGTFYGTQNEFVDFQVHFHDTGSGTPNLSVTVSNFVQTAPKQLHDQLLHSWPVCSLPRSLHECDHQNSYSGNLLQLYWSLSRYPHSSS